MTSKPNVRVMEIGFLAGHSAEVFLKNNETLTLTSFDLGKHKYVTPAKQYIDSTYPGRHQLIIGDSKVTVPEFTEANKHVKFDVIFIDGGNDIETSKMDLANCLNLAHVNTVVILDDTVFTKGWEKHYTIGPTMTWNEHVRDNKILTLNSKDYSSGRGMSWGKYVFLPEERPRDVKHNMDHDQPHLYGCQGYMALKYHMEEALAEKNLDSHGATWSPPIALFSTRYYNEINSLDNEKLYDYCFLGSIDSNPRARQWVIEFAKKHFTSDSVFINTDQKSDWKLLGTFDYSDRSTGYKPRSMPDNQSKCVQYRVVQENVDYFKTMRQSKYVLCPAGDAPWSFRFYEVLMCKSIPIVESWHHTYRTRQEADIKYKYVLHQDIETELGRLNYDEYVNENTRIFETYHLLT